MQKQTRYRILKFDIVCLDCSKNKKKLKEKKQKRKKRKKEKTLNYVKSVFGNKNRLLVHI